MRMNDSVLGNSAVGPHFTAATVVSSQSHFRSSTIRRDRLPEYLNRRVWSRENMVIGGPAGSGKTILALQSAVEQFDTFQYISARKLPDRACLSLAPAHAYASTLAEIANLLVGSTNEFKMEMLQQKMTQYFEQVTGAPTTIVFDDADLIADDVDEARIAIAARIITQVGNSSAIWISRYGREPLSRFGNEHDSIQDLAGRLLCIQEDEIPALLAAETFGQSSSSDIYSAIVSMSGWFTGVDLLLRSPHFEPSELDEYVFRQLIWPQLLPVQHTIVTLSQLPYFTIDLIEHLLQTRGVGKHIAHRILTSFPTVTVDSGRARMPRYRFPEPMNSSIRRVANYVGNLSDTTALHEQSVLWFLSVDDASAAKQAAVTFGIEATYIRAVKPLCATLAAAEQWQQIREALDDMPKGMVYRDADLTFWYMKGCSYTGDWETVAGIRHAVFNRWIESDDPTERGRALLIDAWRNWTQSRTKSALLRATQSYDALPEEAHQDRLWAAIQAENAARNTGESSLVEKWAPRSGGFGTDMTLSPEFWHINCGFHRLNHLAMTGKLQHAYHLASGALVQAPAAFPQIPFRYLLLQAYIDMERGRFESARALLDRAEQHILTPPLAAQFEIATAAWLLRTGSFDEAKSWLKLDESGSPSRPDYYWHRVRLLAEIHLTAGETELAYDVITNWCGGEDAWPKYFGEPHHHLLLAKILLETGALDGANENAQYVINVAQERKHPFYMIQAYAVQSEYQRRLGRLDLQASRVKTAINVDGLEDARQSLAPFGVDVRTWQDSFTASQDEGADVRPSADVAYLSRLTPREREILKASANGMSARNIAEQFFISQSTVKNHMAAIYRKLGVNTKRDAIELVYPLHQRKRSETES